MSRTVGHWFLTEHEVLLSCHIPMRKMMFDPDFSVQISGIFQYEYVWRSISPITYNNYTKLESQLLPIDGLWDLISPNCVVLDLSYYQKPCIWLIWWRFAEI